MGKAHGTIRPVYVSAGARAKSSTKSLYRFTDLHTCFFPNQEDFELSPELINLYKTSRGETIAWLRKGSIGHIETSFPYYEGNIANFVLNGKARIGFWQLPNALKNRYRRWYEKTLEAIQETSYRAAGIKIFIIASNDLVNESLMDAWGHTAPEGLLNEFYDRFAEKRGYVRKRALLTHPVNGANINGDVWVKNVA